MKSTVKYLDETKVILTISIDKKSLQDAEQVALKKLSRDLKVAGFRKGKVPISVAAKHINPNALQEQVLEDAVSKAVAEAFLSEKLQALERPAVEVKKFVPGEELEVTAEAQVVPKIKLGNYSKLKTKYEVLKVDKSEIDDIVSRMQQNLAEKNEVKREAKIGDEAVIDFVGKLDGKEFDGGAATNHTLELGSNQFIPGFEDGVVGHKAGDKFDVPLKFPKDYHAKDLAGKPVVFEVNLKKVQESILPEPNDEFAAKCGPFTSIDEMRDDIKRELTQQKERQADDKFRDGLVTELAGQSKVPLPELLVEDQMRSIEQDFQQNLAHQGLNLDGYLKIQKFKDEQEWREKEIKPAAELRVRSGLVLAELSKELKIDVSRDEVESKIDEMKQYYGSEPKLLEQLKNPEVHRDIANRLITDKTIDKLAEINKKS